jgi:hypothetical protein
MPLQFDPGAPWPPRHCEPVYAQVEQWDAWYVGDPGRLAAYYATDRAGMPMNRPSQHRGGIVGQLARFWWGRPIPDGQPAAKLHVPIASDVAMFSADLLFGSPPEVGFEEADKAVSGAWDDVVEYGSLWARLLEAAEVAAGNGGVYLKAVSLPALCRAPFLCAVPPGAAVPEWTMGWLSAVTFWQEVRRDDQGRRWRHLERYEVMAGKGVVYHAVYLGTDSKLGRPMDIGAIAMDVPDVMSLMSTGGGIAQDDGSVLYFTGTTGLAATFVPNVLPNRMIPRSPHGRADFAGTEPFMDAADETWSSLMRDFRLGRGRLVVPEHFLRSQGAGRGATFEVEQEIFTSIAGMPGTDQGKALTATQFAIRVTEHLTTVAEQMKVVMRGAGYDAAALDQGTDQAAKTATEVVSDASRTVATRSKKIGYWTPAMRWAAITLMEMNAAYFGGKSLGSDDVNIEFPDATTISPYVQAQTLQLLDAAGAISTEIKVRMLHPEWDGPQVAEEVARIGAAVGRNVPSPLDDNQPGPAADAVGGTDVPAELNAG